MDQWAYTRRVSMNCIVYCEIVSLKCSSRSQMIAIQPIIGLKDFNMYRGQKVNHICVFLIKTIDPVIDGWLSEVEGEGLIDGHGFLQPRSSFLSLSPIQAASSPPRGCQDNHNPSNASSSQGRTLKIR